VNFVFPRPLLRTCTELRQARAADAVPGDGSGPAQGTLAATRLAANLSFPLCLRLAGVGLQGDCAYHDKRTPRTLAACHASRNGSAAAHRTLLALVATSGARIWTLVHCTP